MSLQRCIPMLYYQLIILIIFILGKKVHSMEVKIDNYKAALESLRNVTNHYGYSSYYHGRYRRQSSFNRGCTFPNNPLNTIYTTIIVSESQINYKPGDIVNQLTVLEISCNKGYKLGPFASTISTCVNGEWKETPTSCIRSCPSLISSTSTTVVCQYNRIPLDNCINPLEGTIVQLSCNEFYEEPSLETFPFSSCTQGAWAPAISECYPSCGLKRPKGRYNIIMGQIATAGDYPWHVGIYNNQKDFLCGGSIIHHHIILSAAHCFTEYNGTIKPIENYLVAAGKYYREYDDNRDTLAQYSTILEIHIPERFKGSGSGLGAYDIAILILKNPFVISLGVQPVCIELTSNSRYLQLSSYSQGIVTGWGYTQEGTKLSDVLKELTIPYVPYNECYELVAESFKKYIVFDKVCAGFLNKSTSICGGDSGGGYVFKNTLNNRYYIKAIVSLSPSNTELQCDSNQFSIYTAIDMHIDFVQNLVILNRRQQTVVCTQDDCKNENTGNFKGCLLPNNPLHGKYFVSDQSEIYIPGNYVSQSKTLSLTCDTGYKANPSRAIQFLCLNKGQWFPTLGTCIGNVVGVSENVNKSTIPPLPDVSNHKNFKLLPTSDCGIYPIKKRIVNGEKSDLFEFPWMALVSYKSKIGNTTDFGCAGTIINDRYILTAANCLTSFRESVGVRVGEYNLSSDPDCEIEGENISVCADTVQDIEVEEILLHHNYSRIDNDIGLIRLRSPIQFKRSVRPICLPITEEFKFENISNAQLIITGWGYTSHTAYSSAELLKAKVSIVSEMECKNIYENTIRNIVINHSHLCAGGREADTCFGEAGGPLQGAKVVNDDIRYVQYGINSFDKGCQFEPSAYTRIDYFLDWILDNIKI